ncbi:phage recombination protein Bet [Thiorhodococcus mannitoliphagus]|uniref:Phage recombination protein Bet n=1 Tax=Thiorhodococcus mannitoliphagus TaxID=329406 RepID=A0A6P1DUY3_9GAMM|nr:phage recombination protein Bet [Thiorhodococcus mannitoliphagus]NEX19852.1 phage recombination protein Bet [Thiorhodococcus mannitoliphagus]
MPKTTQPTTLPACRLAISQQALADIGLDAATWQVLVESIFPSAKTVEGVQLAVRYCQARGLDIMKRPVHVVPMWNRTLAREVETVWPGIAEVQTTAARTGQWAGMDPARFGPEVARTFAGRAKTDDGWQELQIQVSFPAWCEVTVYRLVGNTRCPFTETVFWEESYARMGGGEVPTAMWVKRPRGQLLKCAKAASLRAAFPEEAGYTAEEMAGKPIDGDLVVMAETVPPTGTTPRPNAAVPDREPTAAAIPTLDEATLSQIEGLIQRATKSRAWASAQDYFQQRFQGEILRYALAELARAEQDDRQAAQAA